MRTRIGSHRGSRAAFGALTVRTRAPSARQNRLHKAPGHSPREFILISIYRFGNEAAYRTIEWRGGAPRLGRSASVVSALWGCVAKSRQAMLTFPPPPLKFRTVGFPQYGFKLDSSATTFTSPLPRPAYTWPIALHRTPVALAGMCAGPKSGRSSPEALRSHPVLLSGLVCATMASSAPLRNSRRFMH